MTGVDDIRRVFRDAGAVGFLHAREIGSATDASRAETSAAPTVGTAPMVGTAPAAPAEAADGSVGELGVEADEPVVLASVFKIAVAIAFERAVAAGEVRPEERTTVTRRYRNGGVGLAGLDDDADLSWRDLVRLMLTVSDNAATDVVFHRLGRGSVQSVLTDLGLGRTRIDGCCEGILGSIADDLGVGRDAADLEDVIARQPSERIRALSALDPGRTSASTPREMTALIDALWSDRAAPADACARVRETMAQQVWPHRLTSGFGPGVRIAGKTGTLPGVRNEVGAVTFPDGRAYAVAVFTRAHSLVGNQPDVDRAIGTAARLAIDALRSDGAPVAPARTGR